MIWLVSLLGSAVILVAVIASWRALDARTDRAARNRLIQTEAGGGRAYTPALVAGLPEPARRYFNYTIQAGTMLRTVAEIDMTGELGLGSQDDPKYRSMQASQILAPPHGLVWNVKTGRISGSDGATPERSWTRFWLFGFAPVVRARGQDHRRAAFGRVVIEGAVWAPASLLPGEHVHWEPLGQNSARVIVDFNGLEQAVDIFVGNEGALTKVVIQRWTNANPEKMFREQPFGGYVSGFKNFSGYRLATRIEVGNHFGTPDYFPFYSANISDIRFPGGQGA